MKQNPEKEKIVNNQNAGSIVEEDENVLVGNEAKAAGEQKPKPEEKKVPEILKLNTTKRIRDEIY